MATQDDWHRITLRIPSELHAKIVEAAKLSSVNSEIITRLEESFKETETGGGQVLASSTASLVETLNQLREETKYYKLAVRFLLENAVLEDGRFTPEDLDNAKRLVGRKLRQQSKV